MFMEQSLICLFDYIHSYGYEVLSHYGFGLLFSTGL